MFVPLQDDQLPAYCMIAATNGVITNFSHIDESGAVKSQDTLKSNSLPPTS